MKTKFYLVIALFGLMISYSCNKEEETPIPVVDFEISGGGCTAPCAVLFNNKTTDATSYNWDFGDGDSSTEASPTKTYNVGGTFTVILTATGEGGTNSKSKQVLVQESIQSQLPSANFTFSGAGTAPSEVYFTNTTENATSYNWDFGDGETSSVENPVHTYSSGGVFSVILTATNEAGTDEITKSVNIDAAPTKVLVSKVTIIQMPFVDTNGSSWDFSSGPDVYFDITDQGGNILYSNKINRVSDITPSDIPLSWEINEPFEITNFNNTRYFELWDYDDIGNDYIGEVGFLMNENTGGSNPYPSTITKTLDEITFQLELIWQ